MAAFFSVSCRVLYLPKKRGSGQPREGLGGRTGKGRDSQTLTEHIPPQPGSSDGPETAWRKRIEPFQASAPDLHGKATCRLWGWGSERDPGRSLDGVQGQLFEGPQVGFHPANAHEGLIEIVGQA